RRPSQPSSPNRVRLGCPSRPSPKNQSFVPPRTARFLRRHRPERNDNAMHGFSKAEGKRQKAEVTLECGAFPRLRASRRRHGAVQLVVDAALAFGLLVAVALVFAVDRQKPKDEKANTVEL